MLTLLIFLPIIIAVFHFNYSRSNRWLWYKNVEKMAPLKYLSNFGRTLEISLINYEINLILTWSPNYIILSGAAASEATTSPITDIKLYVPVVTFSIQDNVKLLQQLKLGFRKQLVGININKE